MTEALADLTVVCLNVGRVGADPARWDRMLRLEDPLDPASPPWRGVGQRLREGGFFDSAAFTYYEASSE